VVERLFPILTVRPGSDTPLAFHPVGLVSRPPNRPGVSTGRFKASFESRVPRRAKGKLPSASAADQAVIDYIAQNGGTIDALDGDLLSDTPPDP
jgi:hypothetical protein